MKILVYSFRTFPYIDALNKLFPRVFIFGKLKEDLERFYTLILDENPSMIIGLARSNTDNSYFESKAINRFNKNAKVVKSGRDELSLFVPDTNGSSFKISKKTTASFCNYTMYKIRSFLEQKGLDIPFAFSHINCNDLQELSVVLEG